MGTQAAEKTVILNQPPDAPVPASVVVLRLQEFGRKPVAEQARLKGQLEALAAKALQPLAAGDRIVLEAPDALAVVVLERPQAALELAERCEAAATNLPLCIGVNHGPVRQANDPVRGPGIVGDGVATGMVLANAATPGRLLASRPFHEALEASSSHRAGDLAAAGELTDVNVRRHEIYTLKPRPAPSRSRRVLLLAGYGAVAVAAAALVARRLRREPPPAEPAAAPVAPRIAEQKPAPAPAPEPAPAPAPKPKPVVAKPAAAPARPPARPASVRFHIKPHGNVFVDGAAKGRTPPLSRIELRPGAHTIEVRNGEFPPLKLRVNLGEAEEMTITHSFVMPHQQKEGLIPRWRRKLGL